MALACCSWLPGCWLRLSIWLDSWFTLPEKEEGGWGLPSIGGRWGQGGSKGAMGEGNIWSWGRS